MASPSGRSRLAIIAPHCRTPPAETWLDLLRVAGEGGKPVRSRRIIAMPGGRHHIACSASCSIYCCPEVSACPQEPYSRPRRSVLSPCLFQVASAIPIMDTAIMVRSMAATMPAAPSSMTADVVYVTGLAMCSMCSRRRVPVLRIKALWRKGSATLIRLIVNRMMSVAFIARNQ